MIIALCTIFFIGKIDATIPNFKGYAPEIDRWLDTHNSTDIAVAYQAVKDGSIK